jgi:molecular chaperone GrpE (heat shock protein)
MKLDFMTILIAVLFSGIGIVVGFLFCKSSCGKGEEKVGFSIEKERIEGLLEKTENTVSNLNQKIASLREDKIGSLRKEIEAIIKDIEEFKGEIKNINVSSGTLEILDEISNTLRKVDLEIPSIDNSLLQKIKDNFLIVRNDLETILSKCKKQKDFSKQIDPLIDKIDSIISLSKDMNTALVKDELLSLAHFY